MLSNIQHAYILQYQLYQYVPKINSKNEARYAVLRDSLYSWAETGKEINTQY